MVWQGGPASPRTVWALFWENGSPSRAFLEKAKSMPMEWIGLVVLVIGLLIAIWAAWGADRRSAKQQQEAIRQFWRELAKSSSGPRSTAKGSNGSNGAVPAGLGGQINVNVPPKSNGKAC